MMPINGFSGPDVGDLYGRRWRVIFHENKENVKILNRIIASISIMFIDLAILYLNAQIKAIKLGQTDTSVC